MEGFRVNGSVHVVLAQLLAHPVRGVVACDAHLDLRDDAGGYLDRHGQVSAPQAVLATTDGVQPKRNKPRSIVRPGRGIDYGV